MHFMYKTDNHFGSMRISYKNSSLTKRFHFLNLFELQTRRVRRVRNLAEPRRIRLGSWNVGSLTGKVRELVDTAVRRRVDVLCVQETKWKGQKAKEVKDTGFKLWYTGTTSNKNGVGIFRVSEISAEL